MEPAGVPPGGPGFPGMAPQVVAAPPQPPGSGAPKGLLGRLATRLGGGAAGAGGQEAPSRPWVTLGLVAAMFATSISLVIYNKWLFSAPPRGHGFPFPIAVTCIHMVSPLHRPHPANPPRD